MRSNRLNDCDSSTDANECGKPRVTSRRRWAPCHSSSSIYTTHACWPSSVARGTPTDQEIRRENTPPPGVRGDWIGGRTHRLTVLCDVVWPLTLLCTPPHTLKGHAADSFIFCYSIPHHHCIAASGCSCCWSSSRQIRAHINYTSCRKSVTNLANILLPLLSACK